MRLSYIYLNTMINFEQCFTGFGVSKCHWAMPDRPAANLCKPERGKGGGACTFQANVQTMQCASSTMTDSMYVSSIPVSRASAVLAGGAT